MLRTRFDRVVRINSEKDAKTDVLVVPTLKINMYPDYPFCCIDATTEALLIDTRDQSLLARLSGESPKCRVAYDPGAVTCAILTGGTLFLSSPVTIPLYTQFQGGEYKEQIQIALHTCFEQMDESLVASTETISSLLGNTAIEARRAPSKYDDYLNAVVVIRARNSIGSGFFVSKDGLILSNAHVVEDENSVSIKTRGGKVFMGKVVGMDKGRDLALIKIQGENFPSLALDDGGNAGVGNDVIAIGTPEGLNWSVSRGIVSAGRTSDGVAYIQTDAPINHGNSGGPLIDLQSGRVVGINTFGFRKDISEGLGFAVAAPEAVKTFREKLAE